METLRLVLLLLHLLGFSALLGGLLMQVREPVKTVNALTRDGAGTAVVAGVLLLVVLEAMDGVTVDHTKIGVKLVIGLAVLALVMANLRKERISDALWGLLLALTVADVAVALFWSPTHGSY
jgi:hypothetical protein